MDRAWLVERQIGGTLLRRKPFRQQVVKHHHVGLLQDLHLVHFRARVIKQNGLLTRFGFIAAQIDGRFCHEGIILRDHTLCVGLWQPQARQKRPGILRKTRIFTPKHRHKLTRAGNVVPGQIVGVGVVVDMLGVFIRSDYVMDLKTTINFRRASHPERSGFHQQRQALIAHKGIVVCCLPVSDNGPGNICHDVMFSECGGDLLANPGADVNGREFWRLFLSAGRTFPREQCTRPTVTARFFPCACQIKPTIA